MMKCKGYKGGTNNKGIDSAIAKAVKRAEWYKANYAGAADFAKRYKKQFVTTMKKFTQAHDLTGEQMEYLMQHIPEQFKDGAK